jgi:hypothetical protein
VYKIVECTRTYIMGHLQSVHANVAQQYIVVDIINCNKNIAIVFIVFSQKSIYCNNIVDIRKDQNIVCYCNIVVHTRLHADIQ